MDHSAAATMGGSMRASRDAIYRRMIELGLTQSELARRAGISETNLSAMLRGRSPIGLQRMRRLAEALGCELELAPRRQGESNR